MMTFLRQSEHVTRHCNKGKIRGSLELRWSSVSEHFSFLSHSSLHLSSNFRPNNLITTHFSGGAGFPQCDGTRPQPRGVGQDQGEHNRPPAQTGDWHTSIFQCEFVVSPTWEEFFPHLAGAKSDQVDTKMLKFVTNKLETLIISLELFTKLGRNSVVKTFRAHYKRLVVCV